MKTRYAKFAKTKHKGCVLMTQCNHTTNQRTFKHLSAIQRGKLFQMVQEKKYTQTQMAQMLGVNQSTISRELKRGRVQQRNTNLEYYTVYLPDYAQIRYQQNRQKCRIARGLEKYDPLFWKELTFELKKKPKERLYSVDTFIAYFKKKHPLRKVPCTKTVYRMIEQGWTEIKSIDLPMKVRLRPRKTERVKPYGRNKKIFGRSIDERPVEVLKRLEMGHWELDVVEGKKGKRKACLLTLLERSSRFLIVRKIANKDSQTVVKTLRPLIKKLREEKRIESITTDNGSEFALLPKLESYGIEVYYAHAYHSWEKGSNERHNRMLREIYPKGTDFNEVKESEIQRSVSVINQRPRQILDYSTPIEKYNMKGK